MVRVEGFTLAERVTDVETVSPGMLVNVDVLDRRPAVVGSCLAVPGAGIIPWNYPNDHNGTSASFCIKSATVNRTAYKNDKIKNQV